MMFSSNRRCVEQCVIVRLWAHNHSAAAHRQGRGPVKPQKGEILVATPHNLTYAEKPLSSAAASVHAHLKQKGSGRTRAVAEAETGLTDGDGCFVVVRTPGGHVDHLDHERQPGEES